MRLLVTKVRFHAAPADVADPGLLGWVDFVVNDALGVDGVLVRRAGNGRIILAYPKRRDSGGREHYIVRPMDDDARRSLEAQVVDQLDRQWQRTAS